MTTRWVHEPSAPNEEWPWLELHVLPHLSSKCNRTGIWGSQIEVSICSLDLTTLERSGYFFIPSTLITKINDNKSLSGRIKGINRAFNFCVYAWSFIIGTQPLFVLINSGSEGNRTRNCDFFIEGADPSLLLILSWSLWLYIKQYFSIVVVVFVVVCPYILFYKYQDTKCYQPSQ